MATMKAWPPPPFQCHQGLTPKEPPRRSGSSPISGRTRVLFHRRHDEFSAVLDARGPAGGDGLGLGPELDRVRAVLVEVAEARGLPAAEGVVGERRRNGNIDTDHADVDARGEIAGRIPVTGEDRDAIAVFMLH